MVGMSKNECDEQEIQGWKKWGSYWKLFLFIVGSCECFQNSRNCRSMTVDSAIEKLQKITKEKEAQKSEQTRKQRGRTKIIKGKRSKRRVAKSKAWSVKYSTISYKVATTFIIIFRMSRRKSVQWEDAIYANDNSQYI